MPSMKSSHPDEKRVVKTRFRLSSSPIYKLAGLFKTPAETMNLSTSNSIQNQADRLGDNRIPGAQRQNLAARIGRFQGNRHLQRVVSFLQNKKKSAEPEVDGLPIQDHVQRMAVGAGASPDAGWQPVPATHQKRVESAVNEIDDMADTNTRLKNYFKHHAPGGTDKTLEDVNKKAKVWEMKKEGGLGESFEGGSDMAYDTFMYRVGKWQLIATLLHEMGHLAKFPTEEECEQAQDAAYVYAPWIQSIAPKHAAVGTEVTIKGISFGPSQGPLDKVMFGDVEAGAATSWKWTHTEQGVIKITVPAGAKTGPVVIVNNNVRSNEVPFTVE